MSRIALLIIAITLPGCPGRKPPPPPPSPPAVELQVTTSKPSYAIGEPVALTLTLKNHSASAVTLSPRWDGNVSVVRFTRDGQPVAPVSTIVVYSFPLSSQLSSSLQAVAAGTSTQFLGGTSNDADRGGQVMRTVSYTAASYPDQGQLYAVTTPGRYELALRYRYSGPVDGVTGVLTTPVDAPPVTFVVTP